MTCLSLVQFCYSNSLLLLHVWGTPLQFRSDPRVEKETIRPFHESYRQFKLLPAHAQIGMYFMYRGAVPGPNARINPLSIEDFIILDIVPVDVSSRS